MSRAGPFYLVHDTARRNACAAVMAAEQGMVVTIRKPNRTLDQNAKFHAMCDDIAKARPEYAGIRMDADDWKALLVLSHATATKGEGGKLRLVPDLEGEGYIQLRESTARMPRCPRSSSLIEYTRERKDRQGRDTDRQGEGPGAGASAATQDAERDRRQ
jgi:hypothetical protein